MRTIYVSLICLCTFTVFAQTPEKMLLKCTYLKDYISDLNQPENRKHDEMVLEIGRNSSAFYGVWERQLLHLRDSLLAQGATQAEIQSAQAHYPRSHQYYEIYKNYPQKGKMTEIDKLIKFFLVEENMPEMKWRLLDEEREVANYSCRKAETTFGNRTWYAWFTPEIPVSDGPWKLGGLPGLILEAEDSERHYHFHCIHIENADEKENKYIQPLKQNYIRCTQSELIKNRHERDTDLNAFIQKMMGITVQTVQSAPDADQKRWNYMER